MAATTSIEISEEAGVRYLHFGSRWVQGAMRIGRAFALELDYTRDMMLPLALRADPGYPRNALLIGLGAASQTKFLYRHCPHTALTVVEIDPGVVAAAREFFKLPDDPRRLAIEIGDGDRYVAQTRKRFDLVLVDGFDAKGHAGALDTIAFYRRCRARLSRRGLLATNLFTRNRSGRPSVERIGAAFDGRVRALAACDSGNTVAIAAAGDGVDVDWSELASRARALRDASGLNLLPTLARLAKGPGRGGASVVL